MRSPSFTASRDFSLTDMAVGTALMLAAIFINKLGVLGNIAFFLLLAVMAIGPVKLAFEALVLGVLALCANQAIVLKTVVWAVGRFAILLGLSGRFLVLDQAAAGYSLIREKRYIALCLFCAAAAFTSLAANNRPEIAILKVLLFWLSLSGVWSAVNSLRASKADIAPWMMKIIATTCAMNLLSLALGVASNFRDERFTQGLFNLGFYHSQTVGPACAVMLVYLASVWLFTPYRNRWICGPMAVVLLYSMYLSGSRTGLLTLTAGLGCLLMLTLMWRRDGLSVVRINMRRTVLVGWVAVGIVMVMLGDIAAGGRISRAALSFVAKGRKNVETITLEDTLSSRQGLIDRAMRNFRESPLIGNGFQMYADREATRNTTIMTSQVEKGFLPAAILEETGVFGTFFFVLFLATCIAHYIRDRNIPGLSAFAALLAMNLGECSFFSFAGHGGLIWCFVAASDLLGLQTKFAAKRFGRSSGLAETGRGFARTAAAF